MSQLDVGCESEASLLIPAIAHAEDGRRSYPPLLHPDRTPGDAPRDIWEEGRSSITNSTTSPARELRPMFVSVAIFTTAIAMTVPTRPQLILSASGGKVSVASYFTGLVDGMTAFVEIFTSPVLGAVSDQLGRRPILALSQLGELFALLIIARFHDFYAGYIVAYFLIGLTGAFFLTVNTIIADVATPAGLQCAATYYGLLGALLGGCFMVGPAVGGFLEERMYPTASFHAAAVMVAVSVLWTSFFVPETLTYRATQSDLEREGEVDAADDDNGESSHTLRELVVRAVRSVDMNPMPRIRKLFSNDALRWLACAIALASLAQGSLNSIFFLYLHTRIGWNTAATGTFLSMVGLSLLISQGFLARLFVRYFGERRTILIGFGFSTLHYSVYGFADRAWIVYAGLLIGCVGFVGDPALKGLLSRQVPSSEQGSLQGGLSGLTTLLRPLSPLFGTVLFGIANDAGRPGLVFAAVSTLSALSFIVVLFALRKSGLK